MADIARYAPERAKPGAGVADTGRSPFARDRARVLHCAALRRLAAKTQVHTARDDGDDFPRTRLTHSLEVAQIAREMGARLGCDPDVVDAAGLAHDLGHPPFGHNGEAALDEVSGKAGGFEGNAQTLRVLTRLEAKVFDDDGTSRGLNLTRAVLDATCKYPWPRRVERRKFGVYADDLAVFHWIRAGAPGEQPCLEAQVMDWADDVAYSVHDVEDGVHGGHISFTRLADPEERAALCDQVARTYLPAPPDVLESALDSLLADPVLAPLHQYDGSHRAMAALKHVTSVLIGRFVSAAVEATRQHYGGGRLTRYAARLVVPEPIRMQCALLKGVALRYVMLRPGQEAHYARQRELLQELVHLLIERAPDALDSIHRPLWRSGSDDTERLRVVIDQVASLTDGSAVAWHRRLATQSDHSGRYAAGE